MYLTKAEKSHRSRTWVSGFFRVLREHVASACPRDTLMGLGLVFVVGDIGNRAFKAVASGNNSRDHWQLSASVHHQFSLLTSQPQSR